MEKVIYNKRNQLFWGGSIYMESKKFTGYVGTYTKRGSKGIYSFTLDVENGTLSSVKEAAHVDNPTYLTLSKDEKYLYSVAKVGEEGGLASYAIGEGELKELNTVTAEGAPPCHVTTNAENTEIYTANYHKGTIELYEVNEQDGTVNPALDIVAHEGSGPHERQEKPHTHYAGRTPNEKYVLAIDLGSDQIVTYVREGKELKQVATLSTRAGSGPRHIAFHPNGKYAYVMTEISSEVIVLRYDEQSGAFTELQYISTIPEDFTENNQGSAIYLSHDGRFVYAGNRGHNSIAVFKIHGDSGLLTFVEHTSTEGEWPRDFVLDPTGEFVVASNQESDNLVLFRRDEETGRLSLLQKDVTVPEPVCVKFATLPQ
jgi:6-phosphogluconolactonase